MEALQPLITKPARLACLLALLLAGCHHLARFCPWPTETAPSHGPICKVVATWNHHVVFTPDPTRNGMPTPGLTGRVYLFDENIAFPQPGDGKLVIDLYDARPDANDGKPRWLEQWEFDPVTLARLLKPDTIGQGYTLFLPWGTCKPDINRVVLKVCYQPPQGPPLYADTTYLTLQSDKRSRAPVVVTERGAGK